MSTKILFTLAMLAVVSVAPHGASASSITNAQISTLSQDENTIASNVQQFYLHSQQLVSNGQILSLYEEQQGLTAVEAELNTIISAEQNELAILQAVGGLTNLVAVQQALISDWGVLLNWEKANGTFTVSKPPTAQAILGVGYGMSLVMFQEENKLYWANEAGAPVLPDLVLYNESSI